ncbi:hypothetical protein WOLCODRAFT_136932 [Wolfiporia cocos MD-104 SS10]|uniref:Uncharacterized protein n=1 Tax=Wolfiporia cocos (strain MD-104) TaxID=742152 RepID=A0A2H3JL51_WOLCO|nr:hypothetical protein WOLCODRAFT_136932 [Wolfiporia cocos MD-104 SS10]
MPSTWESSSSICEHEATPVQEPAALDRGTTLQRALAESIASGTFADVRFYLFTNRSQSRRVGNPRALYASSAVLSAASPYLSGLLAGASTESNDAASNDGFPLNDIPWTDTYDYDSDSDLDDEDSDSDETCSVSSAQLSASLANVAADKGIDVESGSTTPARSPNISLNAHPIRTIVLRDFALVTWQWAVLSMYSIPVAFAPLKSQGPRYRSEERAQYKENFPHRPPPCSPKSMYRLADKLGLETLKHQAFNDLMSKLSVDNIHQEVFSTFSARYSEVLDQQVKAYGEFPTKPLPALQKKVDRIAAGQMPHAGPAVMAMLKAWIAVSRGDNHEAEKEPETPLLQSALDSPSCFGAWAADSPPAKCASGLKKKKVKR